MKLNDNQNGVKLAKKAIRTVKKIAEAVQGLCSHIGNIVFSNQWADVNTKLKHIQNWPELAREVKWSASAMAKKCDVSVRTLHRHFLQNMSKTPRIGGEKWTSL